MTNLTANRSGSIWRRWDLHLHAPGAKLSNDFGAATELGGAARIRDAFVGYQRRLYEARSDAN